MPRRLLISLTTLCLALAASPALAARPTGGKKGGGGTTTTYPSTPNDTYWAKQWGPRQIKANEAWATSTGAGQVVAVVDSGVDLSHPDLQGKLVPGATFVGCATSANGCGNGDWASGGAAAGAPDPHGTHVAGIIAAATNNGIGVAGVAPAAKVMPVKVLGESGGTFEEIAAGIRYAADHGAKVINMSLGGLPGLQALVITGQLTDAQDAIAYARSKGVVVVVAAGNEYVAPLCDEPAFDKGALCVGATDPNELKASYSNLPLKADDTGRTDAVSAPGGSGTVFCEDDIISTVPFAADQYCPNTVGAAGYDYYAGTSMATPHVSGVAALLTAQGRTDDQVVDVLEQTARTPGVETRGTFTPVYGYGIVDALAAVQAPR